MTPLCPSSQDAEEVHPVPIEPSLLVASLKRAIEQELAVPVARQVLLHCGRELRDEQRLDEIRQLNMTEIYLAVPGDDAGAGAEKKMQITLRCVVRRAARAASRLAPHPPPLQSARARGSWTMPLEISEVATVKWVKGKLNQERGLLPANVQLLVEGSVVSDNRRLVDAGVRDRSTVMVRVSESLERTVKVKFMFEVGVRTRGQGGGGDLGHARARAAHAPTHAAGRSLRARRAPSCARRAPRCTK